MPRILNDRRAPARCAIAAAALALALVASPARAQRKAAPTRARAPAASTDAVPLPPPPAGTTLQPAAGLAPRGGGWLAVSAGAWVGFDAGTSLALQVDYGITRTPASWRRLALEYHLSLLVARPTDETKLTRTVLGSGLAPVQVSAGVEEMRAWVVEVVPTARLRMAFDRFAVFADGGVGVAQSVERYQREEMFEGRTEITENVTGLVLRLGAGVSFDASPRTRVVLQPLAFSVQLGPDLSAFTPTLGLSYSL